MVLSDKKYEELKKIALEIYQKYDIHSFPIDMFRLCEKIGIKLVKYSELPDNNLLLKASKDAQLIQEINVIAYNEEIKSKERIQNSLAHEVLHYFRNHQEQSQLAESEAKFWARYFRAPIPVIEIIQPKNAMEIAEFFDISYESAGYAYKNYVRRMRCKNIEEDKDLYNAIQIQFKDFLSNKGYTF